MPLHGGNDVTHSSCVTTGLGGGQQNLNSDDDDSAVCVPPWRCCSVIDGVTMARTTARQLPACVDMFRTLDLLIGTSRYSGARERFFIGRAARLLRCLHPLSPIPSLIFSILPFPSPSLRSKPTAPSSIPFPFLSSLFYLICSLLSLRSRPMKSR